MRISQVVAFAAAILSLGVSSFAVAAPSGSTPPASGAASTVLAQALQHSHKLTPEDARRMRGTFRLEDGRLLVLTSERSKLFAEFDGKREELLPMAGNRFVSRDTGAELTFDQVPFGMEVVLDQPKK